MAEPDLPKALPTRFIQASSAAIVGGKTPMMNAKAVHLQKECMVSSFLFKQGGHWCRIVGANGDRERRVGKS